MAEVDFSEILNRQAGTAETPKALPQGTYYGTIMGRPTSRKVDTKEGPKGVLTFKFALNEAGEDVDADDLEAAGGLRTHSGEAKTVRQDFWLSDESLHYLDTFVSGFGFEKNAEGGFGKSYKEIFEELVGKDVTIALEQRTYTPKGGGEERVTNEVKRVFATENS